MRAQSGNWSRLRSRNKLEPPHLGTGHSRGHINHDMRGLPHLDVHPPSGDRDVQPPTRDRCRVVHTIHSDYGVKHLKADQVILPSPETRCPEGFAGVEDPGKVDPPPFIHDSKPARLIPCFGPVDLHFAVLDVDIRGPPPVFRGIGNLYDQLSSAESDV